MSLRKTISVVMSAYNGEKFLQGQLDSIMRQTRLPDEFLVCDDGSTDETFRILEKFEKKAPFPVHIHRNSFRSGYGENFIMMAQLSKADIIAFCDCDDVWLKRKLEVCEHFFKDKNVILAVHSFQDVDENLKPYHPISGDFLKDKKVDGLLVPPLTRFCGHQIVCSSDIFRGCEFIRKLRIAQQERIMAERNDSILILWANIHDVYTSYMAKILGKIVFISEILVLHRIHGSNTTFAGGRRGEDSLSKEKEFDCTMLTGSAATARYRKVGIFLVDNAALFESAALHHPELTVRLLKSTKIHKKLGTIYLKRAKIYDSSLKMRNKLIIFADLMLKEAYRKHNSGGIGIMACLKDLVVLFFDNKRLSPLPIFTHVFSSFIYYKRKFSSKNRIMQKKNAKH